MRIEDYKVTYGTDGKAHVMNGWKGQAGRFKQEAMNGPTKAFPNRW